MSVEHPSAIELELVRTGEGSPSVALHLRSCEICQAEVAQLRGFAAALGELHEPSVEAPPELDRRVLWHSRSRARAARRESLVRKLPRWAAAAAVVLAVGATLLTVGPHRSSPVLASEDVDGNGAIDIRDALLLAREVEAGHVSGAHDVNGDGRVDEEDVQRIALRAVALRS